MKKYEVNTTKKEANKLLTAASKVMQFMVGDKPIELRAISLTALQSCFGWQKANSERVKKTIDEMGMGLKPFVKGSAKYMSIPCARKVVDYVYANKA